MEEHTVLMEKEEKVFLVRFGPEYKSFEHDGLSTTSSPALNVGNDTTCFVKCQFTSNFRVICSLISSKLTKKHGLVASVKVTIVSSDNVDNELYFDHENSRYLREIPCNFAKEVWSGRHLHRDNMPESLALKVTVNIMWNANNNSNDLLYTEHAESPSKRFKTNPSSMLETLLNHLLPKESYDCVIIVGDKRIPCHKTILSLRSPVFKAMFENEMSENSTNEIVISDFYAETVKYFVKYLYKETLYDYDEYDVFDKLVNIYMIAHKYEVSSLVDYSIILFKTNRYNCANLIDLYVLADTYNEPALKQHALCEISAHISLINGEGGRWNGGFDSLSQKQLLEIVKSIKEK